MMKKDVGRAVHLIDLDPHFVLGVNVENVDLCSGGEQERVATQTEQELVPRLPCSALPRTRRTE
jgi:hypothetical protein